MRGIIILFVLLGIRVIIGINIAQAGKTLNIIIPKNKEEFPIIVEKPSIVVPEIKMENISHFWGPISFDTTTIITQILLNKINLSLPSLSVFCEIYLNNIKMAGGLAEDVTVEKRTQGTLIRFTLRINNNNENILRWWISHMKNGEKTTTTIHGKLIINLGGVDLVYPFLSKSEFRTHILESINTAEVSNLSFGPFRLQIKSLCFEWMKITTNEIELRYRIKIHNPTLIPVAPILNRIEYELLLNEIKTAQGGSGLPLVIWPRGTELVTLTTKLDTKEIKNWWVSHINSKERTMYRFRYILF
ncbi:hypothetical protein J7K28_08185 [Candidatus Aerophobetes bacterium]|nr:hypothetical protein [Candidatus Aerophobetes bacterium]